MVLVLPREELLLSLRLRLDDLRAELEPRREPLVPLRELLELFEPLDLLRDELDPLDRRRDEPELPERLFVPEDDDRPRDRLELERELLPERDR